MKSNPEKPGKVSHSLQQILKHREEDMERLKYILDYSRFLETQHNENLSKRPEIEKLKEDCIKFRKEKEVLNEELGRVNALLAKAEKSK
jgi:hypothetical protein